MEIKPVDKSNFKLKSKKAPGTNVLLGDGKVEIVRLVNEREEKMVFDRPGEYEVGGVGFMGIRFGDKVCFAVHADELTVAHLDGVNTALSQRQTDLLGQVDVLLIEASGEAVKISKELNPSIVVPLGETEQVDKFLEKLNVTKQTQDKLSFSRDDLPDETQVIVLA